MELAALTRFDSFVRRTDAGGKPGARANKRGAGGRGRGRGGGPDGSDGDGDGSSSPRSSASGSSSLPSTLSLVDEAPTPRGGEQQGFAVGPVAEGTGAGSGGASAVAVDVRRVGTAAPANASGSGSSSSSVTVAGADGGRGARGRSGSGSGSGGGGGGDDGPKRPQSERQAMLAARLARLAESEARWARLPRLSEVQGSLDVVLYALRGFGKGALAGILGRSAFGLIPVAVAMVRQLLEGLGVAGKRTDRVRSIASILAKAVVKNRGPALRFGCFAGVCVMVLRACVATMRVKLREAPDHRVHAGTVRAYCAVAGIALGASLGVLPGRVGTRSPLALFLFVRALEAGAVLSAKKGWVPKFEHADTALMMLASAQVCWAWVFQPDTLTPSYLRFMNHHGGQPRPIVDMVAHIHSPPADGDITSIRHIHAAVLAAPGARPFDPNVPSHALHCEVLHPGGASCSGHFVSFCLKGFQRAVKVYLPVYLIPLLTFGHKRLLADPVGSLTSSAKGIARSSLFLGSYCGQAWLAVCVLRQFFGNSNGWIAGYSAGLAGGSAVLYEKKGRRLELALYVLSQALESVRRIADRDGWSHLLWPVRGVDGSCVLFGASAAALLNAFLVSPTLIRSGYLRIIQSGL